MILTPHAILGAVLANAFPDDPALGFGLAFASHYVLDMLPHTDYDISNFLDTKTKTVKSVINDTRSAFHLLYIAADFVAAGFICFILFVRNPQSLFLTFVGLFGALIPDFFQLLYYKFKGEPWLFYQKIHDKLHGLIKVKNEKFWGTFLQIFIPIFSILIYFLVRK
jgi:hypothetical protein